MAAALRESHWADIHKFVPQVHNPSLTISSRLEGDTKAAARKARLAGILKLVHQFFAL